jgi:hypothetical protein
MWLAVASVFMKILQQKPDSRADAVTITLQKERRQDLI